MERQTVVGQIYGYGISLLAILIILASIHGIVTGVFRMINPVAAHPMVAMWHMEPGAGMGGFGGHRMHGFGAPGMSGEGTMPAPNASPGSMMGPMAANPGEMRDRMMGNARYVAVERFVLAIIFLIVGILLFRWHWNWLHAPRVTT